jgi:hypothetical protein
MPGKSPDAIAPNDEAFAIIAGILCVPNSF